MRTGILLVNLGTPKSPRPSDVYRYLQEFLLDPRVIDLPWLKRNLLVRGVIVPFRHRSSAKAYKEIWGEEGSPLLVHGKNLAKGLRALLGDEVPVALGMRYQEPSIAGALQELKQKQIDRLVVFPLFPQYASATTGSVHQKVMELIKDWEVIPEVSLIQSYQTHPSLLEAYRVISEGYDLEKYDHFLFSFHGLPERHIRKADPTNTCLKDKSCCEKSGYAACYRKQCVQTAKALQQTLGIPADKSTICFQSRLGKDPWVQPYTSDEIEACAKRGDRKVLVFCPAFVADCLETTFEILTEYGPEFREAGGKELDLFEGLNAHPAWVQAVYEILKTFHSKEKVLPSEQCSMMNQSLPIA